MEAKSLYQRVVSAVNACTAASSADWLDTALFAQLVEAITDFVRVRCLERPVSNRVRQSVRAALQLEAASAAGRPQGQQSC